LFQYLNEEFSILSEKVKSKFKFLIDGDLLMTTLDGNKSTKESSASGENMNKLTSQESGKEGQLDEFALSMLRG